MTTFSVILKLCRLPVSSKPDDLTQLERYVLAEAFSFLRTGVGFPNNPLPLTNLQYIFLMEAYKVHHEEQQTSIRGPAFERGMQQLNSMGGANVSR